MKCKYYFLVPAMLAFLLVQGCASRGPAAQVDPEEFLHDALFPGAAQRVVESRDEVFELDESAKAYLDERVRNVYDTRARGKALLKEIFEQAASNLSYESGANTTASQTFNRQAANCLSMSILTYSMAKYAGYDVQFQQVEIPEYWERRNNYSLLANHVNVLLMPPNSRHSIFINRGGVEIDFLSIGARRGYPRQPISEARALGMFYNNKAVDALLAHDVDLSYAYLRAALLQDPTLAMAYTNLGLLYLNESKPMWAEATYRQALQLRPMNTVAAEGLATVLRRTDRTAEAERMLADIEQHRRASPYYQFILGEEAYEAGRFEQAIHYYQRAIALKPDAHEFYFGLARSYWKLGDSKRAEGWMRKAERKAQYPEVKENYRGKLRALSSL